MVHAWRFPYRVATKSKVDNWANFIYDFVTRCSLHGVCDSPVMGPISPHYFYFICYFVTPCSLHGVCFPIHGPHFYSPLLFHILLCHPMLPALCLQYLGINLVSCCKRLSTNQVFVRFSLSVWPRVMFLARDQPRGGGIRNRPQIRWRWLQSITFAEMRVSMPPCSGRGSVCQKVCRRVRWGLVGRGEEQKYHD